MATPLTPLLGSSQDLGVEPQILGRRNKNKKTNQSHSVAHRSKGGCDWVAPLVETGGIMLSSRPITISRHPIYFLSRPPETSLVTQ